MNRNTAIAYLEKNIPQRIDMIESIRRGTAEVISCGEDHCLIRNEKTGLVQLAADTCGAGMHVLENTNKPRLIVAHGEESIRAVKSVWKEYACERPCHQAYYAGEKKTPENAACEIRPFPKEEIGVILEHYENITDPAYIRDRIEQGDMFAGYCEGQICGFIGFHRDGSMGMLEVFPAFRHRHIGFLLESDLINRALERGWVPYCHIYQGNTASVNLQKKLGLWITEDCPVAWLHAQKR